MNRIHRFVVLCVGVVLALASVRAADAAVGVKRVVSPGGIEAWLVEEHSVPVLALQFAFRGGSGLDPADKRGLAELAMDTLDEGAGDLDSQAFHTRVRQLGAQMSFSAGMDNITGGLFVLTARRDEAARLLNMALAQPRFDAAAVNRVKGQILADLSQAEENPRRVARETFMRAMFGDQAYAHRTEGTPEGIKAITPDDLHKFASARLTRDHLLVTAVGDINEKDLGALLDRTFGTLPTTGTPADLPDQTVSSDGRTVVVQKDIPQSTVVFGEQGLRRDDPDIYAGLVMNYVLGGGGFESRLTNEVRDKRGLAYYVGTSLVAYDKAGLIEGAVGSVNDKIAESLSIIRAQWVKMRDQGATAAEVKDAKSYLTGSYLTGIGSSSALAGTLLGYRLDNRPIDYLETRNARIEKVTVGDVNRVAKRLLNPDALVFVVVGQPKGVASTTPAPTPASAHPTP